MNLNANDYDKGDVIWVKALKFAGTKDYEDVDGKIQNLYYFKVDARDQELEYRMNKETERSLRKEYGLNKPDSVLGKWLGFRIDQYGFGNGFVLMGVKDEKGQVLQKKNAVVRTQQARS